MTEEKAIDAMLKTAIEWKSSFQVDGRSDRNSG